MSVLVWNIFLDRIYIMLQNRHGGKALPEYRLPFVIGGAVCLPIVIAFYGFTAQMRWPAIVILIACGTLGFSMIISLVPVMSYVVDAFGLYSASALTAVLIARCL